MFEAISPQLFFGQLFIGLINGSFYAILSMGLAIIFGLMHVINFAHGVQYMLGAFCAWALLNYLGIPYWGALIIAPIIVGLFGIFLGRVILRPLQHLDHLYALLATYAVAIIIEGLIQQLYGSGGLPYSNPISGGANLGFMYMPYYRLWIVVFSVIVCGSTWLLIEHTKLGAYLRAANETPDIVESFGVNVPRMITLTYGLGVGLAALTGVLAAPVYQVSPSMGTSLMIIVFAIVVIGGVGSIIGAIITGYLLGVVEALTSLIYPEAANTVVFVVMILVLLLKPNGIYSSSEKV